MKHYYASELRLQLPRVCGIILALVYCSCLHAQLSGTYTIGGGSPDYPTINAAIAELTAEGISGAVIFDVRAGTYTEQVEVGAINGASATNTVTLRSESGGAEDVVITYKPTDFRTNYILRLNGAAHFRIQHLTVRALEFSYALPVSVIGEVKDLTIEDNVLSAPIFAYGDPVLYLKPTRASDVRIRRNRISGGREGLIFEGTYNSLPTGTEIADNVVEAFGNYGIHLAYLQGVTLTGNRTVSNPTGFGLFLEYCDGTELSPVLVANNLIANSAGINCHSVNYLRLYYNSVNANGSAFTLYYGKNTVVKNNLFRTRATYAVDVYYTSPLEMDYNDLSTDGPYLGQWNQVGAADLASWRATSGQDGHSISFDPRFISDTDLHPRAPALADAGVELEEVTTDIDGKARDASPSLGAYEFSAPPLTPLAGRYTIGGTGADFPTFNAAVEVMRVNGISGTVTFDVLPGTYNEQVVIQDIVGGSSANTVTFQSASGNAADVIVTYAATSSDSNYVIQLNNASNLRLRKLTLGSHRHRVRARGGTHQPGGRRGDRRQPALGAGSEGLRR